MPSSQRGTGFVNLSQWLGLNQGSAKAMGDALADDVEAKGGTFNADLNTANTEFDKKLKDAGEFGIPAGTVTSTQAAELGARRWGGPDGFDADTNNRLYGDATAAQNTANATGTNVGRQTLLQKHYGGQNTWGGGALDAALAGSGGGAGRMAASRGAYGRLVASLPSVQQGARDKATTAKDTFNQTVSNWAGAVPGLQQKERLERGAQAARQREAVQVGAYTPQDEEERNRYP